MPRVVAEDLDRRVEVMRRGAAGGAFGTHQDGAWGAHGTPIWAKRHDVSDAERGGPSGIEGGRVTRFTVRWSSFTAGLTRSDRLRCDGLLFDVLGLKEMGRRAFIEITAREVTDAGNV